MLFLQTAILLSQKSPDLVGEAIEVERLKDAVNVILSLQVSQYLHYTPKSTYYYKLLQLIYIKKLIYDKYTLEKYIHISNEMMCFQEHIRNCPGKSSK